MNDRPAAPIPLSCPACQGALRPRVLGCDACGVKVEGTFELNEFAALSGEDLHLLRIFVLAEGRIRDMEAPLGLSYPTIRTRLKALREKVAARAPAGAPSRGAAPPAGARPRASAVDEILDRLKAGKLGFDEAMELVKKAKR
ncbi:MAG: DUF2089 family protein [Anaeromyxobacteraceae bacterium]